MIKRMKANEESLIKRTKQNSDDPSRMSLPQIKKHFTDRDRDLFLREVISRIEGYFRKALAQLEQRYQEVSVDVSQEGTSKFICTIYVRGEIKKGFYPVSTDR
jgi:hypothetical protein